MPPGIGTAYRVFRGDQFLLRTFAVTAVNVQASAYVIYDDGSDGNFPMQVTTVSGAVAQDTSTTVPKPGWVVSTNIRPTTTVKRGEIWARMRVGSSAVFGANRQWLCAGYIYGEFELPMGYFESSTSGIGFKNYRKVADDVTPVDIEETLAVANTLRRIDGFIWYYHASSDVASRTLRASLRDVGDGLPTGMTSGGNTLLGVWPSAAVLTLTQDQEGTMFVKDQYAVSVDNGSPTFEDPSARPNPFPLWISEDDVGEFFFDVVDAEAADRHTIYLIEESWVRI